MTGLGMGDFLDLNSIFVQVFNCIGNLKQKRLFGNKNRGVSRRA